LVADHAFSTAHGLFPSMADNAMRGMAVGEDRINVVKLLRAHGGCLGVRRRRRAWKTAKSLGELSNER